MKTSVFIITGICLTVLESSLFLWFPIEVFKPDLTIPFIIYMTLFMGPFPGLLAAFFFGLFQEGISSAPQGSIIFTKVLIFLLSMFIKDKVYIDSRFDFSYTCTYVAGFESIFYLLLSFLSKGETKNIVNIICYTLPNAIFTGFFSIFIFSLLSYMSSKMLIRE